VPKKGGGKKEKNGEKEEEEEKEKGMISCHKVLFATGRKPNTRGIGLEVRAFYFSKFERNAFPTVLHPWSVLKG
jgi:pyruvate/2-oxoglutarate dehydrogenase complex dihydrolipoamide dehydrogenase (E3) component